MSRHEVQQHTTTELPDPLAPAAVPSPRSPRSDPDPGAPGLQRPHRAWQQVLGGLLLAVACVTAAAWYVPRVLRTDRRLLTGSVVATLNFTSSGEIARIAVHQGQQVRKGQLLATEYAPDIAPVLSADASAVSSEQSKLASMRSAAHGSSDAQPSAVSPTSADVAAVRAQLKLDEAQLVANRERGAASRILAPAAGSVVAANGRAGEAVTTQGIRDYVNDGPRAASIDQTPAFSLLPEGPQAGRRASASSSTLPVIALRTSSSWQVAALVPEGSVAGIAAGEQVFVTVPAAHIAAISGRISQVLPDPVSTPQGDQYQALVTVAGHVDTTPLSGMAANIRLAAPARASARGGR